MKRLRMVAVASAGGHWIQLGRLRPLFAEHDVLFVTTLAGAVAPSGERPPVVVPDASRNEPLNFLGLWWRLVRVMIGFRPHVVITTGAAPGLAALQIGRLVRAHTIWIDSIANSEELSMSGRLARRFADLRLTQWEHLADEQARLRFMGAVL